MTFLFCVCVPFVAIALNFTRAWLERRTRSPAFILHSKLVFRCYIVPALKVKYGNSVIHIVLAVVKYEERMKNLATKTSTTTRSALKGIM